MGWQLPGQCFTKKFIGNGSKKAAERGRLFAAGLSRHRCLDLGFSEGSDVLWV
ncbi:hypothetical protein AK812_SmicGene46419, partial [Symbiodinium microadriaticum]